MPNEPTPGPAAGQPTALQQLEAALAAGHLTPEVFATLRAQLPPDAPAVPLAPGTTFAPSGSDAELPSLLDMFNQPPAVPASPPPEPPTARPAPAGSPYPSAADAVARQRIEEHLAQMRQRPTVEPTPLKPAATPTPSPTFYPEPPAPTPAPPPNFYPEPPAPTVYPAHPMVEAPSPPPARPVPPRPSAPAAESASGGGGRWLWVLLLGLAVAGALAYFFIQASHPDESLTSPSLPAADSVPQEVAAPKPAKQNKKSAKKKRKNKATIPVSTASEAEVAPEEEVVASQPAAVAAPPTSTALAASQPIPAVPEASDDAAATKVREVLAAYYADLHAPPLHASQHFAPQVERLYIQQNLTPATIDAELTRSFFPDNQQAVAQIEPGTLRVSAPANDGSRTATFTENMRLYRASRQQFQRLRTKVRVRFNADYQIAYMRQEKLLANTFE